MCICSIVTLDYKLALRSTAYVYLTWHGTCHQKRNKDWAEKKLTQFSLGA